MHNTYHVSNDVVSGSADHWHTTKTCSPFETACSLARQEAFFSIFKKVVFLSHLSMNLRSDAIFDTHTFKHWFAEKLQFSFFFFFPFFQLPTSKVHYICPFHANNFFSSFGLTLLGLNQLKSHTYGFSLFLGVLFLSHVILQSKLILTYVLPVILR